jgi:hypothetical protein
MVGCGAVRTSVHTRSTWRHIPEDGILHSHRRENLKSYIYGECSASRPGHFTLEERVPGISVLYKSELKERLSMEIVHRDGMSQNFNAHFSLMKFDSVVHLRRSGCLKYLVCGQN